MKNLIIGILIGLILGGIVGYFICNNSRRVTPFRNQNFQIDEDTKKQIYFFFENTTDIDEIRSYCENNRINCFYYCKNINQNHVICSELRGPKG